MQGLIHSEIVAVCSGQKSIFRAKYYQAFKILSTKAKDLNWFERIKKQGGAGCYFARKMLIQPLRAAACGVNWP